MTSNRHIVDRALPQRAKLVFYFPKPSEGEDYYVATLPFFENVSIKETKKARYQKYSMISRSSNLYSYMGADSKQLNLSFNMTLPHIMEDHGEISLDKYVNYVSDGDNLLEEQKKFREPYRTDGPPKSMAYVLGTNYTKDLATDSAAQVLLDLDALESSVASTDMIEGFMGQYGISVDPTPVTALENFVDYSPDIPDQKLMEDPVFQARSRIIDIIIYWTNLIRASVVNYSKNPIYGPPIIRLVHGILYQNIPCICTNYSIDFNEAAGYDLLTLLPRQLKVTMKLEEIRTGDFGEFDPADVIKRDNLTGWESVVLDNAYHSMDPGYHGNYFEDVTQGSYASLFSSHISTVLSNMPLL